MARAKVVQEPENPPSVPVTQEDLAHLERVIRDLADKKYVCPFNDRLVLLLEHDNAHATMLEEHDHAIKGNGKVGMEEQIRILMKERDDRNKILWLIGTAFIGQFVLLYFK